MAECGLEGVCVLRTFFGYAWSWAFPDGSVVKNLPVSAGDMTLISGFGRSPGGENGNPLQYSCLENSTDRGAWQAALHGVAESEMTEHTYTHAGSWLRSEGSSLQHRNFSSCGEGFPSCGMRA